MTFMYILEKRIKGGWQEIAALTSWQEAQNKRAELKKESDVLFKIRKEWK